MVLDNVEWDFRYMLVKKRLAMANREHHVILSADPRSIKVDNDTPTRFQHFRHLLSTV